MRHTITLTLVCSLALIATGVGFYFGTGTGSVTALIPAFIGGPLLLCGLAATRPGMLKVAIHIAAVLALLAALGSSRVFMKWADLSTAARSAQLITLTICVVLLAAYVASFIKARRTASS